MDVSNKDELFLDAVDTIVLVVLKQIEDDPKARFTFFRRLLDVAREISGESGRAPEIEN